MNPRPRPDGAQQESWQSIAQRALQARFGNFAL
jgi:hypothetical protein